MKKAILCGVLTLFSVLCFGQDLISISELVNKGKKGKDYKIEGKLIDSYNSKKRIFFVQEGDCVIPVQLANDEIAIYRYRKAALSDEPVVIKGTLGKIKGNKGLKNACVSSKEPCVYDRDSFIPPTFMGQNANYFSSWVSSKLVYPNDSYSRGIEGTIKLGFTVNKEGEVTDVIVIRGVADDLDEEAVRVVSNSPKWTPATVDGKPVPVCYVYPVIFALRTR